VSKKAKEKEEYRVFQRLRAVVYQVLRDGSLILKLEQRRLMPAALLPIRGPPALIPCFKKEDVCLLFGQKFAAKRKESPSKRRGERASFLLLFLCCQVSRKLLGCLPIIFLIENFNQDRDGYYPLGPSKIF
jgi:hypothetical protein